MGHKANRSFFESKNSWSKRKDLVLSYYLVPYLPKVATQKRPILIVDAFAGPGCYNDGEFGSPLIICNYAREANKNLKVSVKVLAIESDAELFEQLDNLLNQFEFATTRQSAFNDAIADIEKFAASHTVFLYIDPWTVEGLEWVSLSRIFTYLRKGQSIEVLMNFNASSFVRRGLAALKMDAPDEQQGESDNECISEAVPPTIAKLNSVVGGDWWQQTIRDTAVFSEQVQAVAAGYCERLREHFSEVCIHAIKEEPHHQVPKYFLIFGSRSTAALRLMNDAMVKSREKFADAALPVDDTLFETRSFELVPDEAALPQIVLDKLNSNMTRGELIVSVVRSNLGVYSETAIRQRITELIKNKRIQSANGKSRINDTIEVWRI